MSAPITILHNGALHPLPRTLEAFAKWIDANRGPEKKPERHENTRHLIWLAKLVEGARLDVHPGWSEAKGYDIATTDGAFFDIDGAAATEEAFQATIMALFRAGNGFVYSTSHNVSEAEPRRGHIQLIYTKPCPADLHARVWKQLHREFFPKVCATQHNPNRGRNAPKPGADIQAFPGGLVDWEAVLEREPPPPPPPPKVTVDPGSFGDRARLIDRARKLIATLPTSAEAKGDGSAGTQEVILRMHGLALDPDEMLALLREYVSDCPGKKWTDNELREKIRRVVASLRMPRGYLLNERVDMRHRPGQPEPPPAEDWDPDSYAELFGEASKPVATPPAPKETERAPTTAADDNWRDRLSMTTGSKKAPPIPRKCLENVLTVLLHCPDWQDVLRYNEFADRTEIAKALPRAPNHEGGSELGALRDGHVLWAIAWFHEQLGFEPSLDMMHRAMVEVARANPFHPVREWLRALQWDRRPRCDRMLATLFGAEDNEVNRAIGPKWMISAVARIMRPGCQVDHMMVLEGPQGGRKSTALRTLVGEDWFRNSPIDLRSKDAPMTLKGAWVYEFDELDAFRGRDATRIKSFLTLRVDSYRPSYGREVVDVPRQVAFVGSTNEERYLADPTGNRRFWPVRCGVIDIPGLTAARDQLWAEAFARYASSEPWHVESAGLVEQFKAAQDERKEIDPWQERITTWWEELHEDRQVEGVSTADVIESVLGLKIGQADRKDEMRIGAILRDLGLVRKRNRVRGHRDWRYVRVVGTAGGHAA